MAGGAETPKYRSAARHRAATPRKDNEVERSAQEDLPVAVNH